MITPSWKTAQPFSPGPPSSIDILVGQGVAVPCDFYNWADVLSTVAVGTDANVYMFVASFPFNAASLPTPGRVSFALQPPEYIKRHNLFSH